MMAFIVANAAPAGCATLPDAARDMMQHQGHRARVEFENAQGPVPAAKGEAILSDIQGRTGAGARLKKHLAYEQAVNADTPLLLGNRVTLLQNGPDTYRAMFAAIRSARDHVNLETYIFDDDEAGRQFADLLLERLAAGVRVNVVYDSVGSLRTPGEFFGRLRSGGARVLEFNPINPAAGNQREWLLNNRDHRRQLIVDGRVAFTGGINISATYSSAPSARRGRREPAEASAHTDGWRDTHVRVEGPAVAEFQRLFMETWERQRGEPLPPADYFPELTSAGNEIVRVMGSTPGDERNPIFLTLISAISHAEKEVHLTIAYFAPDPQLLGALKDAARRGVDVRLILPGRTDSWAIFNLGRSYYEELLREGVRIHERRGSVMHAKTACIDNVWSTVGSTNLDWRSFLHNDEINAVVLGQGFAAQMEAMFAADLKESEEITLARWRQRSLFSRMKERLARIGAYWL